MTSLTGSTEMTLEGTVQGPTFTGAMFGACLQLSVLTFVWVRHTTAGACLSSPLTCLGDLAGADPWGRQALFTYLFALLMWITSLRTFPSTGTADPSIVDRLWSIMPWLYTWHIALSASTWNPRLLIMSILATSWGLRLTYNFWIKGGFSGGEDYRWEVIRSWFPGWKFEVFNLFFICLFQQCCILAFSGPPAVLALQSTAPLNFIDYTAIALFVCLFVGETVADHQMFVFQTEKYRRKAAGEELGKYSRGFIETGLWAYSRHPNYFCEVFMWWSFYLFSIAATGKWLNWSVWGVIFLTGLFVLPSASCDLTEMLSSKKYPCYPEYQARVSKFIPWCPKADSNTNGEAAAAGEISKPDKSADNADTGGIRKRAGRAESPPPQTASK